MNTPAPSPLAVVVLAAGKGTRMKSDLPKVLHTLAGRSMILHVLDAVEALAPAKVVVVTGHGADEVEAAVRAEYPDTAFVRQTEQKGTAHAVLTAKSVLGDFKGTILIAYGDAPLLPTEGLKGLISQHLARTNSVTEITTHVDDPTGFGRIVRGPDTHYVRTVEEKDCTEAERAIDEVSTCLYAFESPLVWGLLEKIDNNNVKQEYYLTRVMSVALENGHKVGLRPTEQPMLLLGVNTPEQLAHAEEFYLKQKDAV